MRLAQRKLLLSVVFLIFLFPVSSFCQDLTGIWRGYFITESGEQYKYELQINEDHNRSINGVSYSYLDTRFYGKASLVGNFNQASSSALIQETKTIEVKMSSGSVACIMKCFFTYARSGKEEFLEGTFQSLYEKTDPLNGVKRGGDCGGGKVVLRKVITSDFYVEPFLKNKIAKDIPEEKPASPKPEVKNTEKPTPKPPVVKHSTKPAKKPLVVKNKPLPRKNNADTLQKRIPSTVTVEKPVERPKPIIPSTPVAIRDRKNDLVETLTVTSDEIIVRLYDNGVVDGDTVSIYLDGKPLAMNKGLSTVPIILKLKMDENSPEHTLTMYAENMGRIPPNTSLMIVQDGDKRYQVSITSTEQKNAMVRFRYEKKSP
jgi:hypothetical protein